MQGRLENELKMQQSTSTMLKDMPTFVNEWYINMKASRKTAASCQDYIRKVKRFLSYISPDVSSIKPEDITLQSCESYLIACQTKTNSDGTIGMTSDSYQQTNWYALNNFLNFLCKRKYIQHNFMNDIDRPKNKDFDRIQEERILLTQKDFNNILKAAKNGAGSLKARAFQEKLKNRDILIILLFMTTGMRKTALSEINIQDINYETYSLKIIDKGNKHHFYPLSEMVLQYLELWLVDREHFLKDERDALFISERGTRLSSQAIAKLVEKYCKEGLGYKISPHKLRAGFCSILYNKTHDVEFVRRTVGHSNIATTQRYITTDQDEKERAINIMSNVLKI